MKESVVLNSGWAIKQIDPAKRIEPSAVGNEGWLEAAQFPAQIHDILLTHGLVPEEYLVGFCEGAIWTDNFDWLYRVNFSAKTGIPARLIFRGLDTVAEIYLNGEQIGAHRDFYLSEIIDVTGRLKAENTLLIHFHNVKDILAAQELDPAWQGQMLKCKLIRKPVHDFPPDEIHGAEYQGATPWISLLGVYRDVFLEYPDEAEITLSDLRANLADYKKGTVSLEAEGSGSAAGLELRLKVRDENGKEYAAAAPCAAAGSGFKVSLSIPVDNPLLWWPRTMGPQSLYDVEAGLYRNGKQCDGFKKRVGFRKVENPSSMEFLINGKRVRLWGGSMDPLQGYTHCWQPDRARRMFTMVENANMNILRIWAEGHPLPDSFYEEADVRGLLVWQEFFMGHGSFPATEEYGALCVAEARELVLRLRHHAGLLMWCGGNESIMGAEHDGKLIAGDRILLELFPKLLKELDPGRYYHPSSPSGGAWANDPREGDYHTYNCVIEYPYGDYPNFLSECIRTAPPVLHSLRRFVKGDLWPAGYDGKFRYQDTFPFPQNWADRTHHEAQGHIKTGPYWEFYDADTPEQLIYRFAAGYGKDLRRELEHVRMGSPNGDVPQSKRSKGYCSCKLLDTWPKIYCAVIDFFQEGFIPYYTTQRGLQPLLLCFDKKDSIRLWLCNDSKDSFKGAVELGLYHLGTEKFVAQESFPVSMGQGESGIIRDLAQLRFFFPKDTALTAHLKDEKGNIINTTIDYVTEERRLKFPDAVLSAEYKDGALHITSDRFARCVEILGEKDGNPFGWLFSDNYFDLLPGVPKKVAVVDGPDRGSITLKPHYSERAVEVAYKKGVCVTL
ncbi:hypothetical protein AGMMS49587_16420 [Spirochaetia bacterium]|nr:hypothetical protein AGMMS49587_16420 [Spirochaetia bacterium]